MLEENNDELMKSINFEFLRTKWPELAGLGGFAEAYAHSDPIGSLSKQRVFGEQIVEWIHQHLRLPKPFKASLNDLLHNQPFKDVVPPVILTKLHALRLEGNQALHGNKGDSRMGASASALAITHLWPAKSRPLCRPFRSLQALVVSTR